MIILILIIIIVVVLVVRNRNKKNAAIHAAEQEQQREKDARIAALEAEMAAEKKKKEQDEFLNSHDDGESLFYASQNTQDIDYQVRLLLKAAKDETFEHRLLVYNTLGEIHSSEKGKAAKYFDLEKACEYYKAAGKLGAVTAMTSAGGLCFRRADKYPSDAADSAQKKAELYRESAACLLDSASKGHGPAYINIMGITNTRPELKNLFEPKMAEVVREAESHGEKTLTDHKILGFSAVYGVGSPVDVPKALEHLKIAAEAGDFNAKLIVEAHEEARSNR